MPWPNKGTGAGVSSALAEKGGGQGGRGKVGTRERMEGGRRGGMGPYRVLFLFAAADAL